MDNKVVLMNMSGIYEKQTLYKRVVQEGTVIQAKAVTGTDCYCDDLAVKELEKKISLLDYKGIHFIDSGNYHYLTYLWLKKIKKPFGLIFFDNHPDMQTPMFGDILSCGGWVKKALEDITNLEWVLCVGVNEELLSDISTNPKAAFLTQQRLTEKNESISSYIKCFLEKQYKKSGKKTPIYISVDKDVLSESFVHTNWDGGEMSCDELYGAVSCIYENAEVLGIDICGEPKNEENTAKTHIDESESINQWFMDFINNLEKNPR